MGTGFQPGFQRLTFHWQLQAITGWFRRVFRIGLKIFRCLVGHGLTAVP